MKFLGKKVQAVATTLRSISEHTPSDILTSSHHKLSPNLSYPDSTNLQRPNTLQLRQSQLSFPITKSKPLSNPYNTSPSDKPTTPTVSIQTKIQKSTPSDFEWFGTQVSKLVPGEIRLWIQNINGINISHNFNIFLEQLEYMRRFEISFISLTETKLNPYCAYVNENIEAAFQRSYEGSTNNLSNQFLNTDDCHQYGGILSAALNDMSQRVAGKGKDKLGRFNWIDFYGSSQFLRIYTIYRINAGSDPGSGDDTCWSHQRLALLSQNCNTDPRKQVVLDLVQKIKEDIKLQRSIMICGDINEDITSCKGFNKAMQDIGLINLITHEIGDTSFRTHNRGKSIIDGVWVSPNLLPSVIRCGIAPFNYLFHSDHRGIFVDLNLKSFLDLSSPNVSPPAYRRLKFTIPKRVEAYSTKALELWKHQKMTLRIQQVEDMIPSLSKNEKATLLHKIDKEINDIMTASEKRCCQVGRHCTTLFSKEFAKALRYHRQCKSNLSSVLLKAGNGTSSSSSIKDAVNDLRLAKRSLKDTQKNADSLRDQMYDKLATDTLLMHPKRAKKKQSIIKQLRHCEKSRINSGKIRFATKGPRSAGISYILIPDKNSYSDTDRADPTFDHEHIDWIWSRTQKFNGKDISNWQRIDNIDQVTSLVTQVLIKHFSQSSETPLATIYWKNRLSDPDFQQSLLDGTFIMDDTLPSETNELLQSFSRKPNVKEIPLLPTWTDFTKFILSSKESTSSSPSGRHYGHYKALLHSAPTVLKGIFKLMCISLENGIVLERWKNTVTTLICKDNNTPYIHRLRPLHIVESEMQFFSKHQWSYKLINQAEHLKNISASQYGGRKNKQAQSSVLNTILTFDIHRQLRRNFTFNDDDLRANYDRELAHFSAAETRSHGLSHEAGQLLIDITSQQKFYIKTKNGVSSSYYSFSEDLPVWGLGQGISWAGSCWQFTATSIERCLQKHCSGAELESPMRDRKIIQFMKFFIDDTTKICNTTLHNYTLLEQTNVNMQKHFNFIVSTGGSLALDKCRFFFINFAFDSNHDPYMLSSQELPGDLIITNIITGQTHSIRRVEPHEARKTLGCFVSPSHNQLPQIQDLKRIILEWKHSMTFSSLSPMLILQAYETVLKPKLIYRLSTTSLSFKQCEELVTLIRPLILNAHHIHRTFPKVILEAPSTYAGLNFIHFYDLQGYEKLKFLKFHLQNIDQTGDTMLLSLQYTQLIIGVETLFFNLPYDEYEFLTEVTWLKNLWEFIANKDLTLELNCDYAVPFQRDNDHFIMDILHKHFSPLELSQINKIRISLQLLFLSDVASDNGRHILPDIKYGASYRQSKLSFPVQTYSKTWLPLWNKACMKLENHLSSKPLGNWQCRHFSWITHVSPCKMYICDRSIWYQQINSSTIYRPCSFLPSTTSATLPIDICSVARGIQIISTYSPNFQPIPKSSPSSYDTFNLFGSFVRTNETEIIDAIRSNKARLCCDGSVLQRLGSFAYGLAQSGSDKLLFDQHAPVHGDLDQLSSTRCELMGILACIEYLKYLTHKYTFSEKHFIILLADNISALSSPYKNTTSIKFTFSPDMDIILHIKSLLKHLPFRIKFKHVKGHQDKHSSYADLSPLAKLNVQMDTKAKQFFTSPINAPTYSLQSPSLPGEMLSISDPHSRIVKDFGSNLRRHSTGHLAEAHMAKALNIPQYRLNLLDWKNFATLHKRQPRYIQSFLTKSIYKHLPTTSRQKRWKQVEAATCPLCSATDETPNHLYQCTHNDVITHRRKFLKDLRDELTSIGTDPFIQRHLMRMLMQHCNKFDVSRIVTCNGNPEAVLALNEQAKIGIDNFLRGIIVWRLGAAQQLYLRSQRNFKSTGDTWTRKLIQFLFTSSHSVWTNRCTLVADQTDATFEQKIRNKCKSLLLALAKNPNRLPVTSRHLIRRKPTFTATSTIRALQAWTNRIQFSLSQASSGEKRSTSDIRNWFQPSTQACLQSVPVDSFEEEEITFDLKPYACQNDHVPEHQSEIRTVPYLPYVPYQVPTSTSENIHLLNPSLHNLPTYYRDI